MLVSIVSAFGGGVLEDMHRSREREQKEQKTKAGQSFAESQIFSNTQNSSIEIGQLSKLDALCYLQFRKQKSLTTAKYTVTVESETAGGCY